jgi:hypothetical protein
LAYCLVIPLRKFFSARKAIMARFCFVGRRNLSVFAIFQLKFRRREDCLFFVATVSVAVLDGQRMAQASQAKLGRGQARPQNHNKRFPQ